MESKILLKVLKIHKEKSLYHRYINGDMILPLLKKIDSNFKVNKIGYSVNNEPIFSILVGNGKKRILMWSQMHGNESTTTKALFDILNTLALKNKLSKSILNDCTLCVVPILNPDGARLYTRLNANKVDLNRDAQGLSQPESRVLLDIFNDFDPDFCFNLHGQRTIFSAGNSNKPATISFLAPAQDVEATITNNRKRAMEVICEMNDVLQEIIPDQIGIYDDSFNLNCVGDTFQSRNTPTILFEAGHCENDYEREKTREFIGLAMLTAIDYISSCDVVGENWENYFKIPQNEKLLFDIIIRNGKLTKNGKNQDIGILYKEVLVDDKIVFKPIVDLIGNLENYYGHFEIDVNSGLVLTIIGEEIFEGYENDLVLINNELFALNSVKS